MHFARTYTIGSKRSFLIWKLTIFTARNEVGARLCFYRCVILFTGGVPDQVHPPGTRYTPQDQVHPPGPGTPHPPGPGTPPDQVHPPGPGRYGLRAGGTHPTGMQSCLYSIQARENCSRTHNQSTLSRQTLNSSESYHRNNLVLL